MNRRLRHCLLTALAPALLAGCGPAAERPRPRRTPPPPAPERRRQPARRRLRRWRRRSPRRRPRGRRPRSGPRRRQQHCAPADQPPRPGGRHHEALRHRRRNDRRRLRRARLHLGCRDARRGPAPPTRDHRRAHADRGHRCRAVRRSARRRRQCRPGDTRPVDPRRRRGRRSARIPGHRAGAGTRRGNAAILGPSSTAAAHLLATFAAATGAPPATYAGPVVHAGLARRNDLAELNLARVPALSIECGNMRNAQDAALLADPAWRARAAQGIAVGVLAYLGRT